MPSIAAFAGKADSALRQRGPRQGLSLGEVNHNHTLHRQFPIAVSAANIQRRLASRLSHFSDSAPTKEAVGESPTHISAPMFHPASPGCAASRKYAMRSRQFLGCRNTAAPELQSLTAAANPARRRPCSPDDVLRPGHPLEGPSFNYRWIPNLRTKSWHSGGRFM